MMKLVWCMKWIFGACIVPCPQINVSIKYCAGCVKYCQGNVAFCKKWTESTWVPVIWKPIVLDRETLYLHSIWNVSKPVFLSSYFLLLFHWSTNNEIVLLISTCIQRSMVKCCGHPILLTVWYKRVHIKFTKSWIRAKGLIMFELAASNIARAMPLLWQCDIVNKGDCVLETDLLKVKYQGIYFVKATSA